jgi:hypothetical protein
LALARTQFTLGFERPARGSFGERDFLESPNLRGRLRGGDGLVLSGAGAVSFGWEDFFKKQIEECRELERQAVNGEDRAFWRQVVGRWEEQLRQAQEVQTPRQQHTNTRRALSADA